MFEFLKKAFKSFSDKISKPEAFKPEEATKIKLELKGKLPEHKEPPSRAETSVNVEKLKVPEELALERPKEIEKLEIEEKQKGLLQRLAAAITEVKITDEQFDRLFKDLELELIQNNVAFPVIQQLRTNLEEELVGKSLPKIKIVEKVKQILKNTILETLETPKPIDLLALAKEKKVKKEAFVLMFVGTNGHGKSTTIAKIANLFLKNGFSPILAASDTFRAAAIEQLEHHANRLGVRIIKHKYGADPAAVAFDAIKAKDKDIVLIDTAGRQTPNTNLMDEMVKIKRVAKPDLTIFVGEAIAGSDLVEQAKAFNEKVGVDAIILTKADVDDKGGAFLSVVQAINKPILYIGVGQEYEDLEKFEPEKFVSKIL
ncbi:MAG: signal recognition particle-docking protein FtsY [Candidatus Nanoarchaeia archaeon]